MNGSSKKTRRVALTDSSRGLRMRIAPHVAEAITRTTRATALADGPTWMRPVVEAVAVTICSRNGGRSLRAHDRRQRPDPAARHRIERQLDGAGRMEGPARVSARFDPSGTLRLALVGKLTRSGLQPVVTNSEVLGVAVGAGDLPAEFRLSQCRSGRDEAVADQPLDRGKDVRLAGCLVVIQVEYELGAPVLPHCEMLPGDRGAADPGAA